MSELVWRMIARLVSIPRVAQWLIARAQRTPYFHLGGYMTRWWLFNPYNLENRTKRWSWLPSIRLHNILRADDADHPHNHPWHARSIILTGAYAEERRDHELTELIGLDVDEVGVKRAGDTYTLTPADFHNIVYVSREPVWTMFITWKHEQSWGFLVDGVVIPSREYTGRK